MRRPLRRLGLAVLAVVVAYAAFSILDVWWAARQGRDADVAAPAAVVLGAAQYNGRPSPVLQARLDRAAELYRAGDVGLIVVTGGSADGDLTTEAKAAYDYLRAEGLPDEDLRLEVDGTTTYEELAASARFLRREGIGEIVVVTDPYHLRRSRLVAGEVGLEAVGAGTTVGAPVTRWLQESAAVGLGRVVGFRRLDAWLG